VNRSTVTLLNTQNTFHRRILSFHALHHQILDFYCFQLGIVELCAKFWKIMRSTFDDYAHFLQIMHELCIPFKRCVVGA